MSETAREQIAVMMERLVEEYTAGDFVEDWDITGLLRRIEEIFTPSNEIQSMEANTIDREELTATLQEEMLDNYEAREEQLGTELMRALERFLLLQIIDQRWTEHLHDLDYLQQGIHLRGIGGMTDPLVIYKNEAFTLFEDLMNLIWADYARMIFHVEVTVEGDGSAPPPPARRSAPGSSSSTRGRNVTYSGGTGVPSGAMAMAAAAGSAAAAGDSEDYDDEGGGMLPPVIEQRRVDESEQIGRNDPCWCGSGKKFKKCHGA
jgi:preprotein translocase subunit SecA